MKKKIALIITIAVCIVSVSANVYQYREQRRPDCMEPNDRGSDVSGYSGTHTGGDFIFTNM